jgi:hypothetical protein
VAQRNARFAHARLFWGSRSPRLIAWAERAVHKARAKEVIAIDVHTHAFRPAAARPGVRAHFNDPDWEPDNGVALN